MAKKIFSVFLIIAVAVVGLFADNNTDELKVSLKKDRERAVAFTDGAYTNPSANPNPVGSDSFPNGSYDLTKYYASVATADAAECNLTLSWTAMKWSPLEGEASGNESIAPLPLTIEVLNSAAYGTDGKPITPTRAFSVDSDKAISETEKVSITLYDPITSGFTERAITHQLKISVDSDDVEKASNGNYSTTLYLEYSTAS